MAAPSVSIVIPSFNHAHTVRRAVESAINQSWRDVEVIVVDDCSRDESWRVLTELKEQYPQIVTLRNDTNRGVAITLNRGVKASTGDFVSLVASDDWFAPQKIARQMEQFDRLGPQVALVHSAAFQVSEDGLESLNLHGTFEPARGAPLFDILTQRVRVVAPTILFRRDAWEAVGGFDESLRTEDVPFFAALAARGFELEYCPEPLVYKTAAEGSLGRRFGWLSEVHYALLRQYERELGPRYGEAEMLLTRHLATLAAGGGDLRLSSELWLRSVRLERSLRPLVRGGLSIARAVALAALPVSTRRMLRRLRANQ